MSQDDPPWPEVPVPKFTIVSPCTIMARAPQSAPNAQFGAPAQAPPHATAQSLTVNAPA